MSQGVSLRSVVANMQNCNIVVSVFELQSHYYIDLWTNTFWYKELKCHILRWRNYLKGKFKSEGKTASKKIIHK